MQIVKMGNCLRIRVDMATNVPKMDLWGTCDPYVVLVAQSKSGLQMFKSQTKVNTLVRSASYPRSCCLIHRIHLEHLPCVAPDSFFQTEDISKNSAFFCWAKHIFVQKSGWCTIAPETLPICLGGKCRNLDVSMFRTVTCFFTLGTVVSPTLRDF